MDKLVDAKDTTDAERLERLLAKLPSAIAKRARRQIEQEGQGAIERWFSSTPAPAESTKRQAIVEEITHQELSDARSFDQIGYMSRAVIMATLPHRRPQSLEFKRTSGGFTLLMHIPNELAKATDVHLPYGPMPRLMFLWMTTEVTRTRERSLHLGSTRSEFMKKLMLTPRTGKRGNLRAFESQLKGLLTTNFSAWREDNENGKKSLRLHHRHVASDTLLWWDSPSANVDALIHIDADFYSEMLQGAIPVCLDTVSKFKENSLALDIYVWLTYRFATLRVPRVVAWEYLMEQFGSEFSGPNAARAFKDYFKKQLKRVLTEYDTANVVVDRSGLKLLPSPTHIRLRKKTS
ncbi:MAG: hypothetical protein K0U93_29305 [Gammaproteobacteria bacterium]|nr:hypothetical protein [Gammaproteobacteria bacterium]